MSDDFLSRFREEPRPEFAAGLKQRLDRIPAAGAEERAGSLRRRLLPALAWGGLVGAMAFAFALPGVRAAARSFLELFRVTRFAAVPVDPERLSRLQQGGLDLKSLVAEQVEMLEPARPPEVVAGVEAAAAAAGITVQQPAVLPRGASLAGVAVGYPGAFRVSLDVAKLELVAHAAGVEDVEVPAAWNGATIHVQAPPVVVLRYRRGDDEFVLLQSHNPELELPAGVELARLGQLGLRIAGMEAEEARLFARSIDWRSTLLVPIPVEGGTFREVEVRGQKGLLVTSRTRPRPEGSARSGRWSSLLLWARGDAVLALHGPGQGVELLEMAQSVR